MGGGGAVVRYVFCCQETATSHLQKPKGTFVTPMRDFDVRSPRKSAGRNQTNHLLQDHRRSQDGDSFCFKSWPENLEPSSAARTQIFRGNLSLPDSGWPRFVRMFDFSSGTPSLGWWEPVSRPRFCKLEIVIEAKNVLDRASPRRKFPSKSRLG